MKSSKLYLVTIVTTAGALLIYHSVGIEAAVGVILVAAGHIMNDHWKDD